MLSVRTTAVKSPVVRGMFMLLVVVAMILSAIAMWNELAYSLRGVAAAGKVLSHQGIAARTHGCDSVVEISRPGGMPVTVPMHQAFDDVCTDGDVVSLLCLNLAGRTPDCVVDAWTRWLFPLAILIIGVGIIAWWWHSRKTES